VTPVVIDASAGVELATDTTGGRLLRTLLPPDAVPCVPEVFFVECGSVLRRWDLNRILAQDEIDRALRELMAWPLRVTQIRGLFGDAWRLRATVTFADALYVALAEHLAAHSSRTIIGWRTRRTCLFWRCTYPQGRDGTAATPLMRNVRSWGLWSALPVTPSPTQSANRRRRKPSA
jgi:predicted nucleic acid-binding protein